MGVRTSRLAGLALTVVLALAPLAGAVCDTLCAPAARQAAAPSCHEPPPAGATLEADGGHACPDSHDVLQSPQARLTALRDALDRIASAAEPAVSAISPAALDALVGVRPGPFPSPPLRAHQSPILRI